MFRRISVRVVLVLAICFGLTGGSCGKNAPAALVRSGGEGFRATSKVLDDVVSSQMRSHLDDVTLARGAAPSPALKSRGITLSSGVENVSAAAVAESTPFGGVNRLVEKYGDEAYDWACDVIDVIDFLVESGGDPSLGEVLYELQAEPGSVYAEIYEIVTETSDDADKTAQMLLWASCLESNVQ
jgi:hypothetical protein